MEMEMEMEIKHFSHEHPLTLLDQEELMKSWLYCAACGVRCKTATYGCCRCRVFLHKSCAELKQQIQNPFHPHHPLTLLPQEDPIQRRWFTCNACLKPCPRFVYHCNLCNLCLDVKCAFVIPAFEGEERLQHYSHLHPLTLGEKKLYDKVYCRSCGKWCLGPTYGCSSCKFFLHQSCADVQLPEQINHFFHPCPLTLCTKTSDFMCKACYNCQRGFYFHCKKCNFMLDIECALLPTVKYKDEDKIYHFSHRHPLKLSEPIDHPKACCSACQKRCSGRIYVCNICQFLIEESCLKWPREIQHPFHPSHPLTLLTTIKLLEFKCHACRKYCFGFTFHCNQCKFYLHVGCSELLPTIKYIPHSHNLTLMEKRSARRPNCNACKTSCEPPMLKCMDCNFNLHLLCGPLPYIIKDTCHIDPLILKDSPVDSDWNGFYCDVCEKERDPRPSIYYCEECHFVAEVKCVISEVMLSLKGERGDVELRTSASQIAGMVIDRDSVAKGIWQKVAEKDSKIDDTKTEEVDGMPSLTPGDVFNSLTEDEKLELNFISVVLQKEMIPAGEMLFDDQKDGDDILENDQNEDGESIEDEDDNEDGDITQKDDQNEDGENTVDDKQTEDIESILEDSLFSDEAYSNFMEMLDSGIEISMKLWKYEEVVKVGDYMVTRNMASIFEQLYAKYGDISAESTVSPRVKMFFFVMLCGTVYSMRNTKVVDISENLLHSWWHCLKVLQFAGFKIQFAFDHLKRVARAWFGLQVRKTVDDTLSELNGDITKISNDIEKLTTKLEGLKRRRELVVSAELTKSKTVDECLIEALELKWRAAGAGLL